MGEIEPSPRRFVAPRSSYTSSDDPPDQEDRGIFGWSELAVVLRRHAISLACALLVIAQLIIKGLFLGHFFFRQQDYQYFGTALKSGFGWAYLTAEGAGHLSPGAAAAAWLLARIGLYDWLPAAALLLVLSAAASLAAWRLLRTLLGNRPAIVIPLALYLFASLAFPGDGWWLVAIRTLPVQLAIFMTLTAHVRYAASRRFWHAIAAAAWLAFGLVFSAKAALIPLLLYAVTAGFLARGPLRQAGRQAAVRLWRGWVLYLAVAAAYLGVLAAAGLRLAPASWQSAGVFIGDALRLSILPGILGGPWRWYPAPDRSYAYAAPPSALAWACVVIVLLIVAGSVLVRRRAWRAWVILAGWITLADLLPALLGLGSAPAALLALDTQYVADAAAVLAIAVGLAFWPVSPARRLIGAGAAAGPDQPAGEPGQPARQWREFYPRALRPVAAVAVGVIAGSSLWSVHTYVADTSSVVQRVYIGNAKAALAQAPAGTQVVNEPVPSAVMSGLFGRAADAEAVLGPLAAGPKKIIWVTARPTGTIDKLLIFGPDGRLYRAIVAGGRSLSFPAGQGCLRPGVSTLTVSFAAPTPAWSAVLRVGYLASKAEAGQPVTIGYGSQQLTVPVRAGLHSVYLSVHGSASAVVISGVSGFGFCAGDAEAGLLTPDTAEPPGSGYPR